MLKNAADVPMIVLYYFYVFLCMGSFFWFPGLHHIEGEGVVCRVCLRSCARVTSCVWSNVESQENFLFN